MAHRGSGQALGRACEEGLGGVAFTAFSERREPEALAGEAGRAIFAVLCSLTGVLPRPLMLPVRIAGLAPGRYPFDFAPTPADLDLEPDTFHDLVVEGSLDIAETQIVATIEVSAVAHLTCVRTLDPFEQAVEGTYLVVYTSDAEMASGDDDDVRYLAPDTPVLDLADVVRDTLLLALPMHPVAPGAADLDLPMTFGAPETDSRWEGLLRFRDDATGDSSGSASGYTPGDGA